MLRHCFYDSPIGKLLLVSDEQKLCGLYFAGEAEDVREEGKGKCDESCFGEPLKQLSQYFEGRRTSFSIPLCLKGTAFQQKVWTALQSIGYGTTASYSDIARNIGNPKASRAVGLANSRNPIPILIPCHRVIGKNGSLTGFRGGLEIKEKLLRLEGITLP